jgi:hypothetical protein
MSDNCVMANSPGVNPYTAGCHMPEFARPCSRTRFIILETINTGPLVNNVKL